MTKTQLAKALWRTLYQHQLVDLFFEGLMGDAVWVSSHQKAYRLKDLGDTHLNNIVAKYINNGEEVPRCLLLEQSRRKDKASTL